MFRRRADATPKSQTQSDERITSVFGNGTYFKGRLTGSGGIRIEGTFEGEVDLDGLLVIGPTGRVTCKQLRANKVIVAGALRGDIIADSVEIRATGRVWGDVITEAMSTEEGAFLRGRIQMEEAGEIAAKSPDDEKSSGESAQPKKKAKKKPKTKPKSKKKS